MMAQLEWDNFLEGWVCSNCGDDVCGFGGGTPFTYRYCYCPHCAAKIESIKRNGIVLTYKEYWANKSLCDFKGVYWFEQV